MVIAVDSCSLVAYFQGGSGRDIDLIDKALIAGNLILPPIVISEILSVPQSESFLRLLFSLPLIPLKAGVWERAGRTRAILLSKRYKAALADTLVSQLCVDADIALITRDEDFRHFAKYASLRLA
jgi:predicted nucleic acid-binding protein